MSTVAHYAGATRPTLIVGRMFDMSRGSQLAVD